MTETADSYILKLRFSSTHRGDSKVYSVAFDESIRSRLLLTDIFFSDKRLHEWSWFIVMTPPADIIDHYKTIISDNDYIEILPQFDIEGIAPHDDYVNISFKPLGANYQINAKLGFGGFDEDKTTKTGKQLFSFLELTKKWLIQLYNKINIVSTKYGETSECYISPRATIDEANFDMFEFQYTSSNRS